MRNLVLFFILVISFITTDLSFGNDLDTAGQLSSEVKGGFRLAVNFDLPMGLNEYDEYILDMKTNIITCVIHIAKTGSQAGGIPASSYYERLEVSKELRGTLSAVDQVYKLYDKLTQLNQADMSASTHALKLVTLFTNLANTRLHDVKVKLENLVYGPIDQERVEIVWSESALIVDTLANIQNLIFVLKQNGQKEITALFFNYLNNQVHDLAPKAARVSEKNFPILVAKLRSRIGAHSENPTIDPKADFLASLKEIPLTFGDRCRLVLERVF